MNKSRSKTPNKSKRKKSPQLSSIEALNWLREADDWIIIGYSFPDEDLNIRSLFTRALASRREKPYVTAIQFAANQQTRIRYEAFFPPSKMTFLNGGLEMFLKYARAR